jgi:flagellar capping protein FliD
MKYIEELLKDTIMIEEKKKDVDKEIEELEKRVKELREYIEISN